MIDREADGSDSLEGAVYNPNPAPDPDPDPDPGLTLFLALP